MHATFAISLSIVHVWAGVSLCPGGELELIYEPHYNLPSALSSPVRTKHISFPRQQNNVSPKLGRRPTWNWAQMRAKRVEKLGNMWRGNEFNFSGFQIYGRDMNINQSRSNTSENLGKSSRDILDFVLSLWWSYQTHNSQKVFQNTVL